MFRYEKEMIPILKKYLSTKFSSSYFVDEFNSGNGIADLVFSTKIKPQRDIILDYESIYIALNYFNKKNAYISIKEISNATFLSKKKMLNLINFLLQSGNLEQASSDQLLVKKIYEAPVKNMISIEAKLHDWKGGLYQAMRYLTYSNKSYLAISNQFLHRVNLDLLKTNGIGLISVAPELVQIIFEPQRHQPGNMVTHTYLAEKFFSMI